MEAGILFSAQRLFHNSIVFDNFDYTYYLLFAVRKTMAQSIGVLGSHMDGCRGEASSGRMAFMWNRFDLGSIF